MCPLQSNSPCNTFIPAKKNARVFPQPCSKTPIEYRPHRKIPINILARVDIPPLKPIPLARVDLSPLKLDLGFYSKP